LVLASALTWFRTVFLHRFLEYPRLPTDGKEDGGFNVVEMKELCNAWPSMRWAGEIGAERVWTRKMPAR
jgi:hypothetical protein